MSSRLGFYRWNITFSKPRLSLKVLIGLGLVVLATLGFVYVYFYESFSRKSCERCKEVNTETRLAKGSLRDKGRLSESVATQTRFGDVVSTNFEDGRKTNHSRRVASFTTASLPGQFETSKVAPSPSARSLRINRFFSSATTIVLPCDEPKAEPVCLGQVSRSVELLAETTDPNNVKVRCSYDVTGGRIKGSGAQVTWDLSGVKPGTYKAFVRLEGASGIDDVQSVKVTVSQCPCVRPSPLPTQEPSPTARPTATTTPTQTPINTNTHINTNTNANANTNVNTNTNTNANTNANASTNANANTNTNTSTPASDSPFEENYVNQSWPAKLPKDWQSEITVEFRRTYDPKDAPTPSNVNGNFSVATRLPTVLPCGEFSDPKLKDYSASAVVELSPKSDLKATNPNIELKSLCEESGDQVFWTIPFRFKDYVTTRANFKVIFHVLLKHNATGKLTVESHELPESTIAVDWLPGTRGQAYLLLGFFFPGGLGMIFFQSLKTAEEIQDSILHANLWIEDQRQKPIPPPARLRSGAQYRLLFAIESIVREMVSSSQVFIEPSKLKKAPTSELEIEVISTVLANKSARETRFVKYYAGVGFSPEAFTLLPTTEGTHFITLRVFYDRTILYRERIHVDVEGAGRAASA